MPTMPNVVGLNITEATANLILAGITPDNGLVSGNYVTIGYFSQWPITITWIKAPGIKPAQVTAQSPASGTTNVAFNAAINLTVSNFPMAVSSQYSAGGYT